MDLEHTCDVYCFVFFPQLLFHIFPIPWNWCLPVIECDETNKTKHNLCWIWKNPGQWAYLKSLKVRHQTGFEGYLILTGAISQLTTLIKPQYIVWHVSGNPRFQYYSKPGWYFLRCWRNVTYLFSSSFFFPSFHQSTFLVYLEVTAPTPPAQTHIIWLCDTNMITFFFLQQAAVL